MTRFMLALSLTAVSTSISLPISRSALAKRRAAIPGTALTFEVDGRDLLVRREAVHARIPLDLPYPDLLLDVTVDGAAGTATSTTARVHANCLGLQTVTIRRARLEALLENAPAMQPFREKRWEPASAGFSRAWRLDPELSESATHLAAAQARGGHASEAVATLVSAAEHDPVWVAWRLASDPDLARVAGAPELAALIQRPPQAATLRALEKKQVAYSSARGLFAWRRRVGNSMTEESSDDEVWIASATTGAVVARLTFRPGPRGRAASGEVAVDRTLAALGFQVGVVTPVTLLADDAGKLRGSFRATHLRLVVDGGIISLSRDGRAIGKARFPRPPGADGPPPAQSDAWAAQLPAAVRLGADVAIGDGCGGWSYDDVLWIPLAAP